MQCLILAGGLGTRMRGIAGDLPKTLLPVLGRPFADHQLRWLAAAGVARIVYAIGHQGTAIREFAGDGGDWGLDVVYSDEGDAGLGTAGALRLAVDRGVMDEGFLVLYGDSYLPIDLAPVWRAADHGRIPLMTVFRNDGRWDRSNAVVAGGRVTLFEKGRSDAAEIGMDFIDYGISVLNRDLVLAQVPAGKPVDLAGVFHRLSIAGALSAFEVTQRFYEVGSPEGLRDLEAYLRDQEA